MDESIFDEEDCLQKSPAFESSQTSVQAPLLYSEAMGTLETDDMAVPEKNDP